MLNNLNGQKFFPKTFGPFKYYVYLCIVNEREMLIEGQGSHLEV